MTCLARLYNTKGWSWHNAINPRHFDDHHKRFFLRLPLHSCYIMMKTFFLFFLLLSTSILIYKSTNKMHFDEKKIASALGRNTCIWLLLIHTFNKCNCFSNLETLCLKSLFYTFFRHFILKLDIFLCDLYLYSLTSNISGVTYK